MARTKRKTSMRGGAKTIKNMKGGMLGGGKAGILYSVSGEWIRCNLRQH